MRCVALLAVPSGLAHFIRERKVGCLLFCVCIHFVSVCVCVYRFFLALLQYSKQQKEDSSDQISRHITSLLPINQHIALGDSFEFVSAIVEGRGLKASSFNRKDTYFPPTPENEEYDF